MYIKTEQNVYQLAYTLSVTQKLYLVHVPASQPKTGYKDDYGNDLDSLWI